MERGGFEKHTTREEILPKMERPLQIIQTLQFPVDCRGPKNGIGITEGGKSSSIFVDMDCKGTL